MSRLIALDGLPVNRSLLIEEIARCRAVEDAHRTLARISRERADVHRIAGCVERVNTYTSLAETNGLAAEQAAEQASQLEAVLLVPDNALQWPS